MHISKFSNAYERLRPLSNAHEPFPTGPTDYGRSEIVLPNGQKSITVDILLSRSISGNGKINILSSAYFFLYFIY